MPGPQAEWLLFLGQARLEVATRGECDSFPTHDEAAVQLRKLLDGLAGIRLADAAVVSGVAGERVEDQAPAPCEDLVLCADSEQRSDLAPLAPFSSDLDGEI